MQNIRFFIFMLIGACMLMFQSCSTCSRQQTIEGITIDLADLAIDSSYLEKAQKAFFALPTPIELSLLMKNMDISFQSDLLNDPSLASNYLTSQKMALNFGAYVTDLTYAGLYEQSQAVLRYKIAVRVLLEGLGLLPSIDLETIQQFEDNINDKDAVLQIVSDTYASCTAALNGNDRYHLTLAIFMGAWVEAAYISTSMTTLHDNRLKQLMGDQKLVFDLMWQVMSDLKNLPEVAGMMSDLSGLAQLLDKLDVEDIRLEEFVKIKEQIKILRQNIIKK